MTSEKIQENIDAIVPAIERAKQDGLEILNAKTLAVIGCGVWEMALQLALLNEARK